MDKIDLDAIINNNRTALTNRSLDSVLGSRPYSKMLREVMREAIHQALQIASENAKLITHHTMHPKGYPYGMVNQQPDVDLNDQYIIVEEQSILDVEKLIIL